MTSATPRNPDYEQHDTKLKGDANAFLQLFEAIRRHARLARSSRTRAAFEYVGAARWGRLRPRPGARVIALPAGDHRGSSLTRAARAGRYD